MKTALASLLLAALCGCATQAPVVPSLQGYPRVPINQAAAKAQPPSAAKLNRSKGG